METSFAVRRGKREVLPDTRKHTRVLTACDACRLSKTRCDSARPVCAKCIKRGVPCEYPDKDPLSMFVLPFQTPFLENKGGMPPAPPTSVTWTNVLLLVWKHGGRASSKPWRDRRRYSQRRWPSIGTIFRSPNREVIPHCLPRKRRIRKVSHAMMH